MDHVLALTRRKFLALCSQDLCRPDHKYAPKDHAIKHHFHLQELRHVCVCVISRGKTGYSGTCKSTITEHLLT
jgi:hypothetical protein